MSNLDNLKNAWEGLAERDALNAILTDGSKVGGKWDVADFMATGDAEIQTVMNHLAAIGRTPNSNGAALDFGCGVGRLTQALARRFASCVGVDISQQMVQKADALNRYAHCRYVASSAAPLPFPDASFSFIYSNIVLQHVPRRFSKEYLREFVRLLAPDGILAFHISSQYLDLEPVLAREAQQAGMHAVTVHSGADENRGIFVADWVLLTNNEPFLAQPDMNRAAHPSILRSNVSLWTDDYSSILPILKWPPHTR